MELDITKEQFKELLKLAMLGEWMENTAPGESDKEESGVVQKLLSHAKDFGYGNYVEFDEESKKYFITEEFESDTNILDIIGDYHEYALWEGLVLEFSRRELVEKYGEKNVEAMSEEERIEKEMPLYSALIDVPESLSARPRKCVHEFGELMNRLVLESEEMKLSEFVSHLIQETGLRAQYENDQSEEGKTRLENIDELMGAVGEYEQAAEEPTLSNYLENVALITDLDSAETSAQYVTVRETTASC